MEKVDKNDFGEVQVEISEDDMAAYITLTPEKRDHEYKMDELKILLKAAGVEHGVQEDVLQKAVSEKRYYERFAVARGEEPLDGKDGWFEFLFPIHVDTRPKILKDGSVDYASCGQVPSVGEGQEIVHYHPAQKAKDGMNVLGQLLPGRNGRDLARLRGKGFELSPDNLVYTAKLTGKATYQNDILNISAELTLDSDVSYTTTGDVHFIGDIRIRGNVLSGMKVTSEKGSIIVDGYVEAATLVAGKDVVLKNGMQGNGQGKVAAKGDVSGKFFEQTFIDCDGNVAANAIMNCQITCGQDVKVSGRFGAIIGGSVSALHSIEIMVAGNMAEVKTELCAGMEDNLFALLMQHEKSRQQIQEEVEKILDALKKINKILETSPTPDLQQKKLKLTRAKIEKDTRLNKIMKRKQETVDQMSKTNDASITILKRVNPGTEITVNGKHVSVQEEIAGVEYRRRGTGIVSYGLE